MAEITVEAGVAAPRQGLVTLTHVLYAMHGFGLVVGVLTAAWIITTFIVAWPSIIAVIINYIKRDEVRGTYLDSHFSWQLRTFWYAVLWVVVMFFLVLTIIGIPLAWLVGVGAGIWVIYRIIRGWIALVEHKPVRAMRDV